MAGKTHPTRHRLFRIISRLSIIPSFATNRKPDATIIATLRPGTQVRVESKTGDYLRVRSLNDADVIGMCMRRTPFFQAR